MTKSSYPGDRRGKITCQRPSLRAETSTKIWMNGLNPNYNTTRPNSGPNLGNCCRNVRAKDSLLSFATPSWFSRSQQREHPLGSACKLLANLMSSLNNPLLQWTVTVISPYSQWNDGQYHASEDCDCPHCLYCCVSFNGIRIKPIDVCFPIVARRPPCQQCHDSVADPDRGRSAADVDFLFNHSNLAVHHVKLKARNNCRHHFVRHFQLVTKAPHHLYTAQLHIGDCVH